MHKLAVAFATILGILSFGTRSSAVVLGNEVDAAANVELPVIPKNITSFVLGGVFSITEKSTVTLKGIHRTEAFKCAVDDINNSTAILPNVQVLYTIADDTDNSITASLKSIHFVNEQIMAVIGAAGSANTDPIAKIFASFAIPLVSYASSSPTLANPNNYPTLMRTVGNDIAQTKAMVSAAIHFNWKLMAAIGTDDIYGSYGLQSFVSDATNANIRVPCKVVMPVGQLTGVSNVAHCIKNAGIKVVMLFMNEQNAANVIARLQNETAIDPETVFIASDSWATSNTVSLAAQQKVDPSVLAGTLGVIQYPGNLKPIQKCLARLTPENNNYAKFITYWENRFRCSTSATFNGPLCPSGWKAPSSSSPITCRCNGEQTLASDTPNNKAGLVYDAVYSVLNALDKLLSACDTLPESVRKLNDVCNKDYITGTDLVETIRALQFEGLSGKVAFSGVDRTAISYQYIQYNGSTWNLVGTWTSQNASSLGDAQFVSTGMKWRMGSSNVPVSDIRPEVVHYGDAVAIGVMAAAAIGMACTISLILFFSVHWEHPVVKRSSPLFCNLMLVGILMIYADLFLWAGEQSQPLCIIKIWIPLIGFALTMGPMLAKTFRIWKIFENAAIRSRHLLNKHLLVMSGVVIGIEVLLLAIWTGVDPVRPVVSESGVDASILYSYEKCYGNSGPFQNAMLAVIAVYNMLLLLFGSFLSYKTRNVHSTFNESRYIGYSMYNLTLCGGVLLPIYLYIGEGPGWVVRTYIIRSLATLFAITACMIILFGPKVYLVLWKSIADLSDMALSSPNSSNKNKGLMGSNGRVFGGGLSNDALNAGRQRQGSAGTDALIGWRRGSASSAETLSPRSNVSRRPSEEVVATGLKGVTSPRNMPKVRTTIMEDEELDKALAGLEADEKGGKSLERASSKMDKKGRPDSLKMMAMHFGNGQGAEKPANEEEKKGRPESMKMNNGQQ
ncbi:hypothetical protein HK102_013522 [Quaeritorhiza haematococci]|nr:hypothetical protein HK102_013522 [Quaeritorhiza haematococci]